jgi:hypothetical protein
MLNKIMKMNTFMMNKIDEKCPNWHSADTNTEEIVARCGQWDMILPPVLISFSGKRTVTMSQKQRIESSLTPRSVRNVRDGLRRACTANHTLCLFALSHLGCQMPMGKIDSSNSPVGKKEDCFDVIASLRKMQRLSKLEFSESCQRRLQNNLT